MCIIMVSIKVIAEGIMNVLIMLFCCSVNRVRYNCKLLSCNVEQLRLQYFAEKADHEQLHFLIYCSHMTRSHNIIILHLSKRTNKIGV